MLLRSLHCLFWNCLRILLAFFQYRNGESACRRESFFRCHHSPYLKIIMLTLLDEVGTRYAADLSRLSLGCINYVGVIFVRRNARRRLPAALMLVPGPVES